MHLEVNENEYSVFGMDVALKRNRDRPKIGTLNSMETLALAIRNFQGGNLSRNEFFDQLDRVLATEQADAARLLATLNEEDRRSMLPLDVYAEARRRIESRVAAKGDRGTDETCVQTNPADRVMPHPATPTGTSRNQTGQADAPPERMKGVGDTLNGRFVLEECIGFGGMGTVYKALDLRKLEASDRKPYIAIKVLNAQFRGHPKSLIALQREARKAQTLAHPNIVSVYDFDRDGSMVYLTMELLSGQPLSRILRAQDFKGMPFADTMRIVDGMAKALAYAHERGFVHCDFKPANVILTDTGKVKVIDFGIARAFQKPEEEADVTVFDPGSLGAFTPAYASPEMLEHREPDPRDDVYALACITYELLTGRHPFDRLTASQARNTGLRPQRPKNLGQRQWRALRAALSLERATRTPSVMRFLKEMHGERRRPARSVVLVASSLILAAFAFAGIGYFWQFSEGESGQTAFLAAPPARPPPAVPPAPTLSLDAVAPVLAQIPCSALQPSVRDHALHVEGYLSGNFGLAHLKDMLGAVPGVTSVNLDVQQVTDDQCAVINLFSRYWMANRQAGRAASIHTRKPNAELAEGEPLVVDITTPAYQSYVNVDYYVLDGAVVHLVPSLRARANQAPPNHKAAIGELGNWVISKPFGTELVVLLITPTPLFDSLRPESESKAGYLRAVEKQLEQIAAKAGTEKIAVDFVQITTRPRTR